MERTPSICNWSKRFNSPTSGGARSPCEGFVHRGAPSWGFPAYSPVYPAHSPGSNQGNWGGCSSRSAGRGRRSGVSAAVVAGEEHRYWDSFRQPRGFSSRLKGKADVEKYFSESMLDDPWEALQAGLTQPKHVNHSTRSS